ncbi:GumC family protein [Ciceribacter thiooxidans]|uniref:GumC family protein n=1 Tax=Ciceribacter thiooxidans TaxID=1969821 RepID=A0ABV7HXK5_9HYPH|nr:GumC family protein [Ciceribacter thiooxidans]
MDIDIFQLPGILRRRLHYVILTVVVCLALAFIYVLRLTPLYTSSTELLLDPKGLVTGGADPVNVMAPAPQDQPAVDSQIYVMQSRATLEEVVSKLDLVKDPFFAAAVKKAKNDRDRLMAVVTVLKAHVTIERAGQSLVFSISAEHPNAATAADIANSIAAVYLRQLDEARASAARRASSSFQLQASELRDRVLKAELAVEKFKAENGLVSTGQQGLVIDQQVAGLNQQLIDARATEERQRTIYDQAKKLTIDAIESGAIPEVLQSTSIGLLRDRYVNLLDRRSQLATSLGGNHPQIKAINSQIANMQSAIEQELGRVRQSMKSSYERAVADTKALTAQLEKMSATSFDSSAAQIKMRQLESEADAVRTLYKAFLSRAEELGQQQSVNTDNSRVITAAVPMPKSSTVLKLVILAAAGLFGFVLGSTLAVLRELLARQVPSPETLSRRTGLPVLARIRLPRRQAKTSLFGRLPFLRGTAEEPPLPLGENHPAIRALAGQLIERLGEPAMVIFSTPKPMPEATGIVADTVQALLDLGHDVLYAPGDLAERSQRPTRFGRPSLRGALERDREDSGPFGDLLRYDLFRARRGSGQALAEEGSHRIVIVNACSTQAADFLPSLMNHADALVPILDMRDTPQEHLSGYVDALGGKAEIVLGTVLVEA